MGLDFVLCRCTPDPVVFANGSTGFQCVDRTEAVSVLRLNGSDNIKGEEGFTFEGFYLCAPFND